jgi:hypothetical protein
MMRLIFIVFFSMALNAQSEIPKVLWRAKNVCTVGPKTDFESDADFEQRVRTKYPSTLSFFIPIKYWSKNNEKYNSTAEWQYDPNTEKATVECDFDKPTISDVKMKGSYIGTNAFGVKSSVQKGVGSYEYYKISDALFYCSELNLSKKIPVSSIEFDLSKDEAKSCVDNLGLIVTGFLKSVRKYSVRSEPTRSDPRDMIENHFNAVFDSTKRIGICIYNLRTKKIYFSGVLVFADGSAPED